MTKKISHLALIIILLVLVLPNVSYAAWYNPFSWSSSEATLINPFSWSNQPPKIYNPFSWLPGWQSTSGSRSGSPDSQSSSGQPSSGAIYQGGTGIGGLFGWAISILRLIFPLIVSAAIVYFVWNVFQYIIYDTEKDKNEVREKLIWGIAAIFIMMSVWGLVNILQSTFRLDNRTIRAPGIQTSL